MRLLKKPILALIQGGVSPWTIVGGIGVVFAVLAGLTIDSLNRQDRVGLDLLAQKGLALMRSLEAGTRAGMMAREWGLQRLQYLMVETVQQPDVDYILIVDLDGGVRVHSDADRIGQPYAPELDLARLAESPEARSRVVESADGHSVLEVYKRFTPLAPFGKHPKKRRGPPRHPGDLGPMHTDDAGHSREMGKMGMRHMHMRNMPALFSGAEPQSIIFVGLDMTPFEAARRADIRRAIGMALVMLVVGATGVLLLFLSQAYRTTRSSLHREKAFSQHLVEHLPLGVLAVDPEDKILSINPVAVHLLGATALKPGHTPVNNHLPDGVSAVLEDAAHRRAPASAEIQCEIEGRSLTLEVIAAPLGQSGDGEEDLGQVLLLRDLTPIKALQKAVVRNQRLAAVGRLAGGVAHEIRNPLSSIKGFATYFKERSQPSDEAAEMATILIQEVERLDRVVGQLLDFSRPATPTQQTVKLEGFLESSLKRIAATAQEKSVDLDLSVAASLDRARFDPDLMHQVLLNLYLNALEAMPTGGRLSVSAELASDGSRLRFWVSDTGTGIAADGIGQIFDPYFTTKSTGTGLGLAIVHNIVEAHGGEVQVESEPGQGTRFRILLPYASQPEGDYDGQS